MKFKTAAALLVTGLIFIAVPFIASFPSAELFLAIGLIIAPLGLFKVIWRDENLNTPTYKNEHSLKPINYPRATENISMNEKQQKNENEKFCHECGDVIRIKAEICPKCGVRQVSLPGIVSGRPGERKCNPCGFQGQMKTWLRNYSGPQFIAIILLIFYVIPGIIFIAWGWGKYKCPHCGKVGENVPT